MEHSSSSSPTLRLFSLAQASVSGVLTASLVVVLALDQLAAQTTDVFQLQVSDTSTETPGPILITQQNYGTIDMACNPDMSGGWYEIIYDCDADPSISEMLPASSSYGWHFAEFFPLGSPAHGTIFSEHIGDVLPMRTSVVTTALERALRDSNGQLSSSAIVGKWEGIDDQFTTSAGVVFQSYSGISNPLMFRVSDNPSSNVLHFEAMRQHAMWERVAGFVKALGLVDPGDTSQMTPEAADQAWRSAFFNSALYTSVARSTLRLRIAAIHVRGRDVSSVPQPPRDLVGMPALAPKSRLSSPAVVTFSPSTVPWIEPDGEMMFVTSIIKIVPPGSTLDYRLGGFAPGMQIAIQQTSGGTERHELDIRWIDYGRTAFTLPSIMALGGYQIVEARHRIRHTNGTFSYTPWQVLSNQPVIQVNMTGGLGN